MMGGRPALPGEWPAVGIVTGWNGDLGMYVPYGSGVAISDRWMISAAHVTGNDLSTGFILQDGRTVYGIRNVRLNIPGTSNPVSDVRLVEFAPGTFNVWSLLTASTEELWEYQVLCVAYGRSGIQVPEPYGWLPSPGTEYTELRVGTNYMKPPDVTWQAAWTLNCDFDPLNLDAYDTLGDGGATELECQFLGGDSGGGSYTFEAGQWRLIGIHAGIGPSPWFAGQNFGYGATSYDWNLIWFMDQIKFHTGL